MIKNSVMDISALPEYLNEIFPARKIRVLEYEGVVRIVPVVNDINDPTDGLLGILADCPEMSVDKFLARMRKDNGLDS